MLTGRFQRWLPQLVLAPSFLLSLVFVYGFIGWN
ncbi:MAG TPA: sugar ABC transporter permease, partial [Polyangia bacterium]|nr:sugar ABC transporter permease [Polyangia bacterium]